jgi:hypothetical protein
MVKCSRLDRFGDQVTFGLCHFAGHPFFICIFHPTGIAPCLCLGFKPLNLGLEFSKRREVEVKFGGPYDKIILLPIFTGLMKTFTQSMPFHM